MKSVLSAEPVAVGKRPLSVTIISWLFIVAGGVGFTYHLGEFKLHGPLQYGLIGVCLVRLLAILGGVLMLRGHDWGRWLLLAWIAFHVILSAFHALSGLIVHGFLLAVIAYFLLRPRASDYFRGAKPEAD